MLGLVYLRFIKCMKNWTIRFEQTWRLPLYYQNEAVVYIGLWGVDPWILV